MARTPLRGSWPAMTLMIRCHMLYAVAVLAALSHATSATEDQRVDFNRDVRPILSNKCFACHGPDEGDLQAGLRLDDAQIATGELESGFRAIVPGDPDASEAIIRVTESDAELRMPPVEFGKPLSPAEIATLRQWIAEGARYATHWSYVTPDRTSPPSPPEAWRGWPRGAIDRFVLHAMTQRDLTPSPPADRYALVRRVFLDLTGLPPTVAEADAFAADDDPRAFEKLVDDLLQRSSYGEHWARMWLDLARYADSAGYADDPPRTIWAYRDWVIKALNANKRFDEFTVEQIAGDLLPNPTDDQLLATAFHRNTLTNNEGGTQDEEFRNVAVVDRVNTTMAVWMGTTMACAQCHSHKYDPISQEEYFRFFAIWNNTRDADRRDESPVLPVYSDEQRRRRQELQRQIDELEVRLATPTDVLAAEQSKWEAELRQAPVWRSGTPRSVTRESQLSASILADGTIQVEQAAKQDAYVVEFREDGEQTRSLAAIRLESLPHESLPGQGAGHGGGNFVVTGVQAQLVPPTPNAPQGRFVRITNHGSSQILSLAEVQIFSNGRNVAANGTASQHSTAYAGKPQRAIDGNTDGDFHRG
ncbi:MAG: DUF1549 domain-containing protein, partial [Planctomycetota bacterium]